MGIPAAAGVAASGSPPASDQANAYLGGQVTGKGPTNPFAFLGQMNLFIYASLTVALTTTAGSATATVASATGLANGAAINGVNVPPGTTIGNLSGTTVTLAFAPNYSAANVTGGTDNNAVFTGAGITYSATVQVERSFDGGKTWVVGNIGGSGTLAQYTAGTPVSLTFGEPERQLYYRLNCIAYTSGTINYRFSQTGMAAQSLSIGTPI